MAAAPSRIVLVHGFTQTGTSWRPVIDALAEAIGPHLSVEAVDAPGHGTAGDVRLDLAGAAASLAAHIDQSGGPALVVGYSMGGRLALRLALDHPEAVSGLVLIGATAGIDDPEQRSARRAADEELARRLEADGVEAFLDAWLAQPLFAGLVPAPADLAARRANTVAGLASSLRLAGTGTMDPPWWHELPLIDVPTIVVWGADDHKFAAIGRRLATSIGDNARTVEIGGVGHAAHLEAPATMATEIARIAAGLT